MRLIQLSITLLLLVASLPCLADEGMWVLSLLSAEKIEEMQRMGSRLTREMISDINGSSMKDAVVIFGGGCTGEMVSESGLLFTNHHCGYSAIQQLSTVENNLLRDGFWSKSTAEDLPVKDLEVRFLYSFEDVTAQVLDSIDIVETARERQQLIADHVAAIEDSVAAADPDHEAIVESFFADNQFFLIKYTVFRDVRLVATPPESIGKFGYDTDNWQWPRHTGDFSVFRVYANQDNEPADYADTNRPYRPKYHLPISLKGQAEGDFAMTIGYPGSTERYLTSFGVRQLISTKNKARIEPRDIKQKIWMESMTADEETYLKYANKYSSSSNYYKNSIGMNEAIKSLGVVRRKEAEEKAFNAWAKSDTTKATRSLLRQMKRAYNNMETQQEASAYWTECLYRGPEIFRFALTIDAYLAEPDSVTDADDEEIREIADKFYKDYSPETDKRVVSALCEYYGKKINKRYHPAFFSKIYNSLGFERFAENLFRSSLLTSKERFYKVLDAKNYALLASDNSIRYANDIYDVFDRIYDEAEDDLITVHELSRNYMAARMRMEAAREYYSDANFTMRLSIGKVGGYSTGGKTYNYWTDLQGVVDKEDTTNYEFYVDADLKRLHSERDYGRYADRDGTMHVCFLTDNDITGGNSGSPVVNAGGELTGLAFDGNWEAMSGDIIFEPTVQRTICVDIRYVLFLIEKLGKAHNLIDELTIRE